VKFRAGLFDHPYVDVAKAQDPASFVTKADRAKAREAADKSMVLLKNNGNTLPFDASKKTAVIGPLAQDTRPGVAPGHDMLGPWWGAGRDEDAVSVYDGIKAQSPGATYAQGCEVSHVDEVTAAHPNADGCDSDAGFATLSRRPRLRTRSCWQSARAAK